MEKTITEKCIEVLRSNISDELKIELITLLNKPIIEDVNPSQPIIWPTYPIQINRHNWWDDQPQYKKYEITCKAEDVVRG